MAVTAARVTGGPGPEADRLLADTTALARRCYLDPRRDLGIGARHLPEPSLQETSLPGTSLQGTSLACREPACREPACREPASRPPADREPASRPPADREPASQPPGDPQARLRHACEQALPGYRGSRHAARERLEHELATSPVPTWPPTSSPWPTWPGASGSAASAARSAGRGPAAWSTT